jgi:glutamate carboxypeptidase
LKPRAETRLPPGRLDTGMADQLVAAFLEAHLDEQLRFIIDLCDQNSHTYNKAGTDRVADMIAERLDGLLPMHEVHRQKEVGDHHLWKTTGEGKAIYLLGHLDTVFPPGHPFQRCRIEDQLLRGPGTGDMKGGVAVLVYALLALGHLDVLDRLNLVLILNGDEEGGSATSRTIFESERNKALACLVAECGGPDGEFVISRNGKMGVRLDCYGTDRHVGSSTHEKASAILELAHRIIGLESFNAVLPGVSSNAGKIEGGLGPTTIAAHASCLADIRWESESHHGILLNMLEEATSKPIQSGCRTTYEVLNCRPAMPAGEGSLELYEMLQRTGRRMGYAVSKSHRRGSSDANFFGAAGVPTLDGFGPICENDHTGNEWIRISSILLRTTLLALFLIDLGQRFGMIRQSGRPDSSSD